MICIGLLDHAQETFPAGDVNSFPFGIIVNVVGIVHTRQARNRRASIRVERYESSRLSGNYENSAIGFIERHRVVTFCVF